LIGSGHFTIHTAVTLSSKTPLGGLLLGAHSGTPKDAFALELRALSLICSDSIPAIERDLVILLSRANQRKKKLPRQRLLIMPSRPGAWSRLVPILQSTLLLLTLGAAGAAHVLWMQKVSISVSTRALRTALKHASPHLLRGARGAAASIHGVLRRLVAPFGGKVRNVVGHG
jgi:hypothetical protein